MSDVVPMPDKNPDYLIDTIMPAREIHLLGGPSGAGKTRWLLSLLINTWSKGQPVFGYRSFPVPWAYVASDRSSVSVDRTLTSMDIPSKLVPIIPAWDKEMSLSAILDGAYDLKAKLVVIESFGSFIDQRNPNSACVRKFLMALHRAIVMENLTIIGIMESPKMKPAEVYQLPRQRISGAAAWAHFTETIMLVEPLDVDSPDSPSRRLTLCPRNAETTLFVGDFRDGTITFAKAPKVPQKSRFGDFRKR
jgi:hypothetical protein